MKKLFALLLITALLIASMSSCVLDLWSGNGNNGGSEGEGGSSEGGGSEGGAGEGDGEGDEEIGEPGGTGGSEITGDDKPFLDNDGWTDPRG